MHSERWLQVNELFNAAVELEPARRAAFLDESCSGDHTLRREVETLLASDEFDWDFIENTALEVAAPLLADDQPQLSPGQRIGRYKVVSLLGQGGMGEVYLTTDEKLHRKVALKLLPFDYTRNKDRLRRFEQEAQAASALNHPNILTIHELGEVDGRQFIATEFVEGETLRQRLDGKPLALFEALETAIQIAGALSVAHKAGIVHRDIKPENIMLRPDGYVKILDFGLAKLTEQAEPSVEAHSVKNVDISSGLVMGTVKYMSPEQARGLHVDSRSDIFSFGVVLYEMLTGRSPFEGKAARELIAAILENEPPPMTNVPAELDGLVIRALCKKKEDRYQTFYDLLLDLKNLQENKTQANAGVQTAGRKKDGSAPATSEEKQEISTVLTLAYVVSGIKRHKAVTLLFVASLAAVIAGLTVGLYHLNVKPGAPPNAVKITRVPNADKALGVAISPDGEHIAYSQMTDVGTPSAKESLWAQEVATNNRVQLIPPADVEYGGLTYSRDGASIFYISNDVLYQIPARGGEVTEVLANVGKSISFSPDSEQFAFVRFSNAGGTALMTANVNGGNERVVAERKKPEILQWPTWSPDGSLIACPSGVMAKSGVMTVIGFAVATGEEKRITEQKWDEFPGRMTWDPDGSSLMISAVQENDNEIWQVSYPSGEPRRITSDPNYTYQGLSITSDGKKLVTIKSATRSSLWILPESNPDAAKPITSGEHQLYRHIATVPDGRILYASSIGTSRDIWIVNVDGMEQKQLTANAGVNLQPQPSADGRYVVFSSNRANKGAFNLWRMDIDGSNQVQLTNGRGEGQPVCSPDGRWVVYSQGGPNTTPWQKTLWKVSIDGGDSVQLSDQPSSGAAISPDGTLIACWYAHDLSTQGPPPMKIALIPFAGGPPIKILDAIRTSIYPVRWSPDGQAVNYIDTHPFVSNIWSQPIGGGPPKQVTQFTSELIQGFDWSLDGQLLCSRLHGVQDVVLISDFK